MVILRMTPPLPENFECEVLKVQENENKNELNLVRPCERYKELYKSCRSFKSRIYQYYVYGETLDCTPHWDNYQSCLKYRKTKNVNLLEPIIKWEKNLIKTRLETVKQNKAWEMRDKPPEDFNKPLPEFIEKRQKESLLRLYENNKNSKDNKI